MIYRSIMQRCGTENNLHQINMWDNYMYIIKKEHSFVLRKEINKKTECQSQLFYTYF